jgi:hypothetical protein
MPRHRPPPTSPLQTRPAKKTGTKNRKPETGNEMENQKKKEKVTN